MAESVTTVFDATWGNSLIIFDCPLNCRSRVGVHEGAFKGALCTQLPLGIVHVVPVFLTHIWWFDWSCRLTPHRLENRVRVTALAGTRARPVSGGAPAPPSTITGTRTARRGVAGVRVGGGPVAPTAAVADRRPALHPERVALLATGRAGVELHDLAVPVSPQHLNPRRLGRADRPLEPVEHGLLGLVEVRDLGDERPDPLDLLAPAAHGVRSGRRGSGVADEEPDDPGPAPSGFDGLRLEAEPPLLLLDLPVLLLGQRPSREFLCFSPWSSVSAAEGGREPDGVRGPGEVAGERGLRRWRRPRRDA